MNLLRTDEVFFIGLAKTAAIKKAKSTKTKKHNEKHYDTKQHQKQTKKKNKLQNNNLSRQVYIKKVIYYIHPDTDSLDG